MLRVLTLNYEFPPIGGGGGNAHKHILKECADFPDLDITLLCTTNRPEPYSQKIHPNVQGHFIPMPKKQLQFWRRSEVFHYVLTHYGFLQRFLKDFSFDLCHAFFGFPTGLLSYWFRQKMPYIVSARGSDIPGYNQRFSLDYVILKPLLKRIYQNAAEVTVNSQGLRSLFENQFPSLSPAIIPNGVDAELFYPSVMETTREFTLVTVARLIPRKGIDLLIHACKTIEQAEFPFRLLIVGEGPEQQPLRKLTHELGLQDHIQFEGSLSKVEVADLLPSCDLFVLPSYAEGMSNAVLEAMACGLPVIVAETGGSMELINGNGIVVPPGDAKALAEQILFLLTQQHRLGEMGRRSRELAEQMTWKQVAASYRDLYYKAASG
ncbi:glycosyltransferase [bacterium]|nr:glycosyltransferase [bacterium]